jgi:hypothetical protein
MLQTISTIEIAQQPGLFIGYPSAVFASIVREPCAPDYRFELADILHHVDTNLPGCPPQP